MKARELMTAQPEIVTPEESVTAAARLMRKHDIGAVPVVGDDVSRRLEGILTDRDIVVRHVAAGHRAECAVAEHMTRREDPETFATAREEDTVDHLLDLMRTHAVRRIPIVDENDEHLVGIVAQADVLRLYGAEHPADLERVLSEISAPAHPHPVTTA
ncbi:MAG TPA: CBS domain-containing protein [Gemmatimonadota bacterium]|nr:CBS domain-containing protein [Gemmatimonadota bacterium]